MHSASRRAAIYCRLSYAPDGSVEKVERQEADARLLAEQRGWTVTDVYTDNNKSAWSRNRRRPGWQNLLNAIRSRRADVVIVYHLDRLMRQPHDLEELLSLADRQGITLASPHGSRDLDNPDDRFVLRIEVAQACREVDNISRRSRRGWAARAEQGAPRANGVRAYGWERDGRTINRHEAAVIRCIARQLTDGQSLNSIVDDLNRRAEPTSAGKTWTISTLRKLMTNPRLIGQRTYNGQVVAKGQWRPILPADTFQAVQLALAARRDLHPHSHQQLRTRRYLLSGIARCGVCTGPLYVQQPGAGRNASPSYTCRSCRKVSRAQPQVDAYVTRAFLAYREGHTLPDRDIIHDEPAAEEMASLRDRIAATLHEFRTDDLLTPAELRAMLAPLKARLDELERQAAARVVRSPADAVSGPAAAERWAALDLRRRREVLQAAVTITVDPAGGSRTFDKRTIHITPRVDDDQGHRLGG